MTDIVERLESGVIEYEKRWSGDTHSDFGGSVDYEATEKVMDEAAAEIRRLREKVAKADALVDRMDQALTDLTAHGGYTYEDDFPDELAALAAYREADA